MAKTPTVALCRAVIFGVLSPCDRLQCGCEDTGRGYGSLQGLKKPWSTTACRWTSGRDRFGILSVQPIRHVEYCVKSNVGREAGPTC